LNALQSNSGGNGGLSLRKRSAMLWCLQNFKVSFKSNDSIWDGMAEDSWYSECLISKNATLAPPHIANRFSIGSKCEVDSPLGMHKIWMNCNTGTCLQSLISSQLVIDIFGRQSPSKNCPGGEEFYRRLYKDVDKNFPTKKSPGVWNHFITNGVKEGREWRCLPPGILQN
jgi:hypothetical protein